MKNLVLIFIAAFFCGFAATAQKVNPTDLCVVTFADGKTFYAKVLSTSGAVVNTMMLHSNSLYSFTGKNVTASEGAYKVGHKCKTVAYYGGRVKDLWYVGDFIEVTFADGASFFAEVESMGNDGYETRMLHSGNKYKFNDKGVVVSSTGVYKAGHKTKSILLLKPRK
jgi:hypothetical protein